MPDFIHQGSEIEPRNTEAAASGPSRRLTFRSRRPGSSAPPPPKKDAEEAGKKKKKDSKLFTDYYGMMFLFMIAVCFGTGYIILNPLYAEFKTLNGEIEAQVQTLENEQGFLDSLNRSIAAAEAIPEQTLVRVDEALPKDIEIPKLLAMIAKISEDDAVTLSNVQFTPLEEEQQVPGEQRRPSKRSLELVPIGIAITLQSGGYQDTRAFLEDLERNLRVLDVRTITATSNEQDGSLSYAIELTAYAAKKPERVSGLGLDGIPFSEDEMIMEGGAMDESEEATVF